MTTSNSSLAEFRLPQEPAMDDLGPIPSLSSDGQSFVVIKSAADLDDLFDDNELSHISMIQENKQLVQEELAQLHSTHLQPSSKSEKIAEEISKPSATKGSFRSTIESLPNGLDRPNKMNNEMNQSILPAMPQPQQICPALGVDENDSHAISIVSFSPNDFGSEEIQAKVTQLIDENMHLKDTIIQNNLSMRAQYDRIVAWQNDVTKIYEAHKEKFREAKKCIETLKEENAAIKQENDNLRYNLQIQQTEHDKTKKLLTETSENNLKEFQLDIANKKIKELEVCMENMNLTKGKSQADAYNWKAMEEKLLRYENELEQAYKKIRELEKGTEEQDALALQVDQLKLVKEKLLLSEMAVEQNNKEIDLLRSQLARNQQTSVDASKIHHALEQAVAERDQLTAELEETKKKLLLSEMNKLEITQKSSEDASKVQVMAERNLLIEELESRNATILNSQSRIQKLEEDLQRANSAVLEHQQAVRNLQEKEEQARVGAWMTRQKMAELEQKYQQLLQQNAEPAKSQFPPDFNPGELAYIRQQLMQSQKALIESEQNKALVDAQVRTLNNEIAELNRQLQNQQTAGDDHFALRAQLEVYKADFEAEREAKDDVLREKNKIAEDLQHLHRRNLQLQEEIEIAREQLQQQSGVPTARREFSRPQASAPSRDEYIYKCPKCNFGFRTLNAIENHVVRCIELDDSLP